MALSMPEPGASPITEAITALVASTDLGAVASVEPLPASGNNRAFRVETQSRIILVKRYFTHPSDPRNRLDTEFRFTVYADAAAPGSVPRPIARHDAEQLAAYEFIDGAPFRPGEVTAKDVDAAIDFFAALNTPDARRRADGLPMASEAVFSLAEHIQLVDRRLSVLFTVNPEGLGDAAALIRRLVDDWRSLVDRILRLAEDRGLSVDDALKTDHRCVSPSDFGFHNALQRRGGGIVFHDFEYAGWDDPTRMLGDFFAQPAVPVPSDGFAEFLRRCVALFPAAGRLDQRAALMRPIYLAKWCCIALGVFVPLTLERRKFANPALDEAKLKKKQIAIAAALHETLRKVSHELH
ncbi:aminoglycoside phosphotransferase family protein (plasmid) [Azospirillum sp. 412522]|nr:aminoglycoside phosphotransferase family protein [Azospirillum sp. 412522]MBY6266467.1 aminoglycoside phosphotransferase family protein [Azospirillum sp. 412522]